MGIQNKSNCTFNIGDSLLIPACHSGNKSSIENNYQSRSVNTGMAFLLYRWKFCVDLAQASACASPDWQIYSLARAQCH